MSISVVLKVVLRVGMEAVLLMFTRLWRAVVELSLVVVALSVQLLGDAQLCARGARKLRGGRIVLHKPCRAVTHGPLATRRS